MLLGIEWSSGRIRRARGSVSRPGGGIFRRTAAERKANSTTKHMSGMYASAVRPTRADHELMCHETCVVVRVRAMVQLSRRSATHLTMSVLPEAGTTVEGRRWVAVDRPDGIGGNTMMGPPRGGREIGGDVAEETMQRPTSECKRGGPELSQAPRWIWVGTPIVVRA